MVVVPDHFRGERGFRAPRSRKAPQGLSGCEIFIQNHILSQDPPPRNVWSDTDINVVLYSPVMYRSAWTSFSTDDPEPAHTATVSMTESKVRLAPMATLIWSIPAWRFNLSTAWRTVIGWSLTTEKWRPAPNSGLIEFGKITVDNECGNDRASQSLTPPLIQSQAVCGEYKAMRFSKHVVTIRSFHELKIEQKHTIFVMCEIL